MARRLIDESKTEWVPEKHLIPDGDPDVQYEIRAVSVETHRAFVKRHTTPVLNRRTHRHEDQVDFEAVSDDVFDHALVGWRGIEDSGRPAPCDTLATKKKLPGVLISAISEYALQTGGVHGRTQEERRESFPAAPRVV